MIATCTRGLASLLMLSGVYAEIAFFTHFAVPNFFATFIFLPGAARGQA
jgi:hypothetical protein